MNDIAKERIRMVSPRIKFIALHCLFCEALDSDWLNRDEDDFIEEQVKEVQSFISEHAFTKILCFKKQYNKIIYWKEGMDDNDFERMYQNRLRELDL